MTAGGRGGAFQDDFLRLFDKGSAAGLANGDLLARFVDRRDEGAFAILVGRLGPMVWGVCRRMLRDEGDAEDAFQATFLILTRRAGSIRNREVVATWLYGVAVRVARRARDDAARRARRERLGAVTEAPESREGPERSELRDQIDEEISRLPESHRRVIILCDLEGLGREEAATLLGWSHNMVRGRLERARARLRDRLTRRGLSPSGASLGLASIAVPPKLAAGRVAASASAVVLSEGVIRMMVLGKLRSAALALLSAGVIVAGPGYLAARQGPGEGPADDHTASRSIGVDLNRTQSQLRTEFLVKYHNSRRVLRTDPALAQVHLPYPARVNEPLLAWRTELAVKGPKTYSVTTTTEQSAFGGQDDNATAKIFDGRLGWEIKGGSPDARMMQGGFLAGHRNVMLPEEDLYLEINGLESARQGIGVTFRWLDPAPFSVARAFEAGEFRPAAPEVVQGRRCVVLERPGLDKVWLDPSRGHALLKREWNWAKGEPLRARITNTDFKEVAPDLWLPWRSLIEYGCKPGSSAAGQVCLKADLVVDELAHRVPDSTFVPRIPSGTVVWDYENNSSWIMPPMKGKTFQTILDESRFHLRHDTGRPGVRPVPQSPWTATLVLGIALMITGGFAYLLRRRRKVSPRC